MNEEHIHHGYGVIFDLSLLLIFVLAAILYVLAAAVSNRRHKSWPKYRYFFWFIGILSAATAVVGPLADRAHLDFSAHMLGHLLLGMLAPLLIALAAPMSLILRTLNVNSARCLSRLLKSGPFRMLSDPVIATFLNVGGLWILYTTDLYMAMQHSFVLHLFIHLHIFLAGFLFTVSIIYIDPVPHRTSFIYRAIILMIAIAGHDILSKFIYARPPTGVLIEQAEIGGLLMYYGGDAIDLVLISILCFQWYRAGRPRTSLAMSSN